MISVPPNPHHQAHGKHIASTQQERLAGAINLSIPITLILNTVKEMTGEELNPLEYILQKVAEISKPANPPINDNEAYS